MMPNKPEALGRPMRVLAQIRQRLRESPKWVLRGSGVVVGLLVILFIVSFFLDEPIRRSMEANMNKDLTGYSVRLPGLHFQLIGLAVTLKDLTVSQNAHPTPPVARFPLLYAHVRWRGLLHGSLAAEFQLDRPQFHMNLSQLDAEVADTTPVKDHGWHRALKDIYPLRINHLLVRDGDVVYIDQDTTRPLHLGHVNMEVDHIPNVRSADRVYPSSFRFESAVFERGRAIVDGHANFLAEPTPGLKAVFRLDDVALDYFRSIVARSNLVIHNGVLATSGDVEYAPTIKMVHVRDLVIAGMEADYIRTHVAAAASNNPDIDLRIDRMTLTDCTFGMVNKTMAKPYRTFIAHSEFTLTNLSHHFVEGPAEARLSGKFMGSGNAVAIAHFRPETAGPDFDVNLKIENTQLRTMNDMLRAYGNFDVTAGIFSLYTQLTIRNNVVSGYIKPLFRDIKVYDKRQDREKSLFHKLYEMLAGGVAKLLENSPRGEVATKATLSGPAGQPRASILEIIGQLIRNAFLKAILPGFDRQVAAQHH